MATTQALGLGAGGLSAQDTLGSLSGKGGDGGQSTAYAVNLAKQQAMGKLSPEMEAALPEGFGIVQGEPLFNPMGRTARQQQAYETWNPRGIQEREAQLNRIATENPYGSSRYVVDELGNTTLVSEFSPAVEALMGQQIGMATGDIGSSEYQTQAFDQARAQLDPMFAQQRQEIASTMQARGIPEGSEIYNEAMRNQDLKEQQAYEQAAFSSIGMGANLEAQKFGQIAQLLGGSPTFVF